MNRISYILDIVYSRLCTLLWGVCKHQEARIQALEEKALTHNDIECVMR